MIVDRRTFDIKAGHLEEAVQLLMADVKRVGNPTVRYYTSQTGRINTLVIEHEHESLAAYEHFWHTWTTAPEAKVFLEKWQPLNETSGTHELWTLVE